MRRLLSLAIGLFWLPAAFAETIRIGVLAYRDAEATAHRWQPLAEFLARQIPDTSFSIVARPYQALEEVVRRREVDVLITQPAHYILLKEKEGLAAPILTIVPLANGAPLKAFGGVIVVRADRTDIHDLSDLKGKKIATSAIKSFGGSLMQLYELQKRGIERTMVTLLEVGMPHDRVVEAVIARQVDAGFVRTGVVEGMIAEGKIAAEAIRVLNPQQLRNFPLHLSTSLYPEWPVVVLPHLPDQLARALASAMLALPLGGEIASRIGIYGFDLPADYDAVEEVLRALRAPPFDAPPALRWRDVWRNYRTVIVVGAISLALLTVLLLRLLLLRGQLLAKEEQLKNALTQQKEETNKLLAVAESVKAAVWQRDLGIGVFRCEHGERLGFPLPPAAASSWEAFLALFDLDERQRASLLAEGEDLRADVRLRDREGRWHWVLLRASWQGRVCQGLLVNIDARKRLEMQLRAELERSRRLLDALGEGVFGVDRQGRVIFCNRATTSLLGYPLEQLVGANAHALFHSRRPDGAPYPVDECPVRLTLNDGQPRQTQEWFWRSDGQPLPVLQSVAPIEEGAVVVFLDLSAEWTLRERERILSRAVEAAPTSILVTDRQGRIVWVNEAFERLSGYSLSEAIGRTPGQLSKSGQHGRQFYEDFWRTLLAKQIWDGEIINRRRDGSLYHEAMRVAPVLDEKGEIQNFIAIKQDITDRKRLEEELRRQASIDSLTGLANRRAFYQIAEREFARIQRGGAGACLLLADLDRFKQINDRYGHAAGDMALTAFARLLEDGVRQMDSVARWGGEEFIALLPETTLEDAAKLAERLRARFEAMVLRHQDVRFQLTASFGISLLSAVDKRIDEAISRADAALYRAKESGRNRVVREG